MSAIEYPGYVPSNVNKDAKYSVVHGDDGFEVRLIFRLNAREKALLTTKHHDELVEQVNAVKREHNGVEGGAFYINEFMDVLVPTTNGRTYFAGTYQHLLEFELDDDVVISPKAGPDLRPGDVWPGPHVGIRYTLKANGRDIGYKFKPSPRIEREELLSDHHGADAAAELATRLIAVKGQSGRIYINECGEFFSPPPDLGGEYLYLGGLDEDLWFPAPDVDRP